MERQMTKIEIAREAYELVCAIGGPVFVAALALGGFWFLGASLRAAQIVAGI